jgi:phage gp29-like protein
MAGFLQRVAGMFRPAPLAAATASGEIKSTPAKDNPYPRRVALGAGIGMDRGARDLPVYTWTEWDSVTKVKAALSCLEGGNFMQAAQLVDAMGRDDRIAGVLATRVNGLLGLPIDYDEAKRDRIRVAKALKDLRSQMLPRAQVRKVLRSGIMLGAGLAENVWTRTETSWTPRLKWWHPQFLQWRWDTRSYWVQTMDGQVEVTPGDGQWVIYAPYGEQLGQLDSMVRALAVPWLVRQWARRDWARYSEVHGMPIRKAKVPAKAEEEDKERFIDEIAQLAQECTIRLPQGSEPDQQFDLELLEASADSWEGFQALIEHTNSSIAITLLGQNLTTEIGKGDGSRAAAQVHDNVRQDVVESDASSLDECLHEQTIRPWALYNFADADGAPIATFHTEPPEDLAKKATTFQTLGNALTSFKGLRVPVDVAQVMTDFEVPVVEGKPMPDLTEEPEPEEQGDPQDDPGKGDDT